MKQLAIFSIFAFLAAISVKAQYLVQPGSHVDEAKLGMPVSSIINMIGKPSSVVTYQKEKDDWSNFGYDVSNTLVFTIPFDKVYIFPTPNKYDIWKIYTLHDTAVIFNQSSVPHDKGQAQKFSINSVLRFYDDTVAIKINMGNDFTKRVDENNNTHVIYKNKGIFFILIKNELRNVFLFKPVLPEKNKPVESCEINIPVYTITYRFHKPAVSC